MFINIKHTLQDISQSGHIDMHIFKMPQHLSRLYAYEKECTLVLHYDVSFDYVYMNRSRIFHGKYSHVHFHRAYTLFPS